ncbi:MAG: HAD family hydrolase [Candidatus Pacebacteria bacterium]|nr:HAD family hydrolase [Candidatus Paceibacterota bacterium]
MNKFKFGIFDLDGSIVNAMPTYTKVFSESLNSKFGINIEKSKKYYQGSAGTPIDIQFKYMLEKYDQPTVKVPQIVDEFFDVVNNIDFALFDGARNTISGFFEKGFKLFLTTGNQTINSKNRLEKTELIKYFSLVLGSDEILKGPEHIKRFAQLVDLSVEEFSSRSFYCGDGPRDMEIARIFGIYAIGIATTASEERLFASGADVVVNEIADVVGLKIF